MMRLSGKEMENGEAPCIRLVCEIRRIQMCMRAA